MSWLTQISTDRRERVGKGSPPLFPLSPEAIFQEPQWLPEIASDIKPYIYAVFSYAYILMIKFNLWIRYNKRLTIITNDKIELSQYTVIKGMWMWSLSLITKMAARWLTGRGCIQDGLAGQRDDPRPGLDRASRRKILSLHSELMNCLFLEFPIWYFWTAVHHG